MDGWHVVRSREFTRQPVVDINVVSLQKEQDRYHINDKNSSNTGQQDLCPTKQDPANILGMSQTDVESGNVDVLDDFGFQMSSFPNIYSRRTESKSQDPSWLASKRQRLTMCPEEAVIRVPSAPEPSKLSASWCWCTSPLKSWGRKADTASWRKELGK